MIRLLKLVLPLTIYWSLLPTGTVYSAAPVKPGLEILLEKQLSLIQGKRVGIVTNQTGVDRQGRHIVDLLAAVPGVKLTAIFAPEHGLRGTIEAGYKINNQLDAKTGTPIYSIYGKINKPTPEMLRNIEVLVFDMQDVGARFYTYISTMSLCMEAAAENNIDFIVLDRPNPIDGIMVEGPVLGTQYRSFTGIQPIPVRHGMTIGELARMFNEEGWLTRGIKVRLTVVPMEGWKRETWRTEWGLPWVKPSPNIVSPATALLYVGVGLVEGTNVSEGRGTPAPFENVGAPWLTGYQDLAAALRLAGIPGVVIDTVSFIPHEISGMAAKPQYQRMVCHGIKFAVTRSDSFPSVALGMHLIAGIKKLHPEKFSWKAPHSADYLFGDSTTGALFDTGKTAREIQESWGPGLEQFKNIRAKYLLY
jgi:uncharacterized protein YbbC (DUF1343 family)